MFSFPAKRSRAAAFLLACLLGTTLACALSGTSSPAPATDSPNRVAPTSAPFTGTAAPGAQQGLPAANRFAPFNYSSQTSTPTDREEPALSDVDKAEAFEALSSSQQEMLLEQGSVVLPQPFSHFAGVYATGAEQKLPAFITADLVLHSLQVVIDVAWQRAEANYLVADLEALSRALAEASLRQWEEAQVDAVSEAARRNLAFFSVGGRLLDAGFPVAPPVADVVEEELTLIEEGGRFISPLFGTQQDYGRFTPQGYYGQSEASSRYYRAMAWYGRPYALDGETEADRQAAAQLFLMALAARDSDNLSRWERIFHPVLYFRGAGSSFSLTEVQAAARTVFGEQATAAAVADVAAVDDFLATLRALPPVLPFDPAPPPTFSFMPRPARADEAIMRELVFNRVGTFAGQGPLPPTAVETSFGAIRGLPRALDVPAALGSEEALGYIEAAGDADYEGYAVQLAQLREHFTALGRSEWTKTGDGSWTYGLQPLLAPPEEALPAYMRSDAWRDKQLNTWYGAWSEQEHDTRLEPRPVQALVQSPDAAIGYVEPQPVLYGRLAAMTRQIVDGLDSRGLLQEEVGQKLVQMERLLGALETISRKELAGERLTADEASLKGQLVARFVDLTTFAAPAEAAAPLTDGALPRIVDVYLDSGSGKLLQAALGEAWPLYVLVPGAEGPILAQGAVFSTYELLGEQMPADAWQEGEERPQPPSWLERLTAPD